MNTPTEAEKVQPTAAPQIEGAWVKMGGKEYLVPPLNFKALRQLHAEIAGIGTIEKGTMPTDAQMGAMVKVVHRALVRNYPDITEETTEDLFDFGNLGDVLNAVLNVSGVKKLADVVTGGDPAAKKA